MVPFLTGGFPAAVYRARRWRVPTALVSVLLTALMGWWIAHHPEVRSALGGPAEPRSMARPGGEYETHYPSHPEASFAAQVWTNNAEAAGLRLVHGAFLCLPFLCLPVLWILFFTNVLNLAPGVGLMASAGRLDTFLGLVLRHGPLELTAVFLTAVFVATGTGPRLGWAVVDPGPLPRRTALAREGAAAVGMAIGLILVLLASGAIEGFVTPSGLPTWARIATGVAAEVAFPAYVYVLGGPRSAQARRATWRPTAAARNCAEQPDVHATSATC
ncbi:hypothetical protein GCM10023082_57930 [Streptomyces tremellae]|uniref:Stage II sporulation protein M n=1 Tax=Streptomyces tremellae TaxID=1124239 RepID=A0ABP7G312_9ACTN